MGPDGALWFTAINAQTDAADKIGRMVVAIYGNRALGTGQ
jgi:hypothetical protein